MNINGNFSKICHNNGNNIKLNKSTFFCSPYTLQADTFSFTGLHNKSYNLDDIKEFGKYLLSIGMGEMPEEKLKFYHELYGISKGQIEGDFDESYEKYAERIDFYDGLAPIDKIALRLIEVVELSRLIESTTTETFKTKKKLLGLKTEDVIEDSIFAKYFLKNHGLPSGKDFERYLEIASRFSDSVKEYIKEERADDVTVGIYGVLDDKEDLSRYIDILLYMCAQQGDFVDISNFQPNGLLKFLKDIGVKETADFLDNFDYLAPKYNDFEELSDVYGAISDVRKNYPKKIDFLKQLALDFPELFKGYKEQDYHKLYANNNAIVDYIYSKQDAKDYQEKIKGYADFLANSSKLSNKLIKQLAQTFALKDNESEINFMDILAEADVSIDELSFILNNSSISDNDIFACIANKSNIVNKIQNHKNISFDEAEKIYLNFAGEYNALINKAEDENECKDTFDGLLKRENVTDEFTDILFRYGVVDLINSPNSNLIIKNWLSEFGFIGSFNSKQQISAAKFTDIMGLLQLFNSKAEVIESSLAKKENKTEKKNQKSKNNNGIKPFQLREALEKEKEKFFSVKDEIKNYLEFNEHEFYEGKTILEIYKILKDIAKKQNIDNIFMQKSNSFNNTADQKKETYKNIKSLLDFHKNGCTFDLHLSEQLDKFIPDRTLLYQFRTNNEISLVADDEERDEEYISNCIKILELFEGDLANNKDIIEYLSKSDFLKLSKNQLSKFFDMYPDKLLQKNIIEAISKSKIKTIQMFNKFAKNYADNNGNIDNLIKFLKDFPYSSDFQTFKQEFLKPLEEKIKDFNLFFMVDNSNILSINPKMMKPFRELKLQEIIEIINSLSKAKKDKNFISKLSKLLVSEPSYEFVCRHDIANEYLTQEKKNPYVNLERLLNINDCLQQRNLLPLKPEIMVQGKIPDKFLELINDTSWTMLDDFNILNMPLHAKMRFIDRFILPEINSEEELYSLGTREKMNKIIKTIYEKICSCDICNIQPDKNYNNRFIVLTDDGTDKIKVAISGEGSLITLFKAEDQIY